MIKTLLVSYSPRFESNTKKLIDTFLNVASDYSHVTHLDLGKDTPPFLLADNLNALVKRNLMGMELTEEENVSVKGVDRLLQQLLDADRIVIAFPMYNFSLPAAVKAWIDAVIQDGKTFKNNKRGRIWREVKMGALKVQSGNQNPILGRTETIDDLLRYKEELL